MKLVHYREVMSKTTNSARPLDWTAGTGPGVKKAPGGWVAVRVLGLWGVVHRSGVHIHSCPDFDTAARACDAYRGMQ